MNSRKAREKARTFVIQALYQWHFNREDLPSLEAEFRVRNDYHKYVDWEFFHDVLASAIENQEEIDAQIETEAGRPLKELNPTELAILRAAAGELKGRIDVPFQVVLSEYVDLTEEFGATDAHQFVNAVLDRLSHTYRKLERNAS